jgi:predicted HicB family RNase H-like nuclease
MERQDETVRLLTRLDETLHRRLTLAAKRSARSLNGEILWRLRKSFAATAPQRRGSGAVGDRAA